MGIKERKEREKQLRKSQILDAAQSVIFEKGLDNITMDEIAEAAELSKGTLYLYFKNKDSIQYELSERGADLLMKKISEVTGDNLTGVENLLKMGWAFVEFASDSREYFNLFLYFHNVDLAKMELNAEAVEDYFLNHSPFTSVLQFVQLGIKDGSIRKDLAVNDTATALWSTLLGLLIVQENKKEIYEIFKVDPKNIILTTFDIVLNGIRNS